MKLKYLLSVAPLLLVVPSVRPLLVQTSPDLQAQEPLFFRCGPSLDEKDEFAFEIRNTLERAVRTENLRSGYNALSIESPDGRMTNNAILRRRSGPIAYPTLEPETSKRWVDQADNILGYSYRLTLGLYRIRWDWREPWQNNRPTDDMNSQLKFLSEPISVLVEPQAVQKPSSPFETLYDKPVDKPGDPDIEPTPIATPAPRLNTRGPLEMAAVLGAPVATIAFIFTNEGAASTSTPPLGSVGNGFTIVTPTNGIVRQTLKAAPPQEIAPNAQKVWKADITAFFKGRKLNAPGWYQLFWKLGERKAGPLWLYKAPPQKPTS